MALGGSQTRLEIIPASQVQRFTINIGKHITDEQLTGMQELLLACDHAHHVLEFAGISDMKFSFEDLTSLVLDVRIVAQLLAKQPEGVPISFLTPAYPEYEPIKLLYVGWIRMADVTLAYHAVVTMTASPEADEMIWRPTIVEQPQVSDIGNHSGAYDEFVKRCKSATGLLNIATQVFNNPSGEGSLGT